MSLNTQKKSPGRVGSQGLIYKAGFKSQFNNFAYIEFRAKQHFLFMPVTKQYA